MYVTCSYIQKSCHAISDKKLNELSHTRNAKNYVNYVLIIFPSIFIDIWCKINKLVTCFASATFQYILEAETILQLGTKDSRRKRLTRDDCTSPIDRHKFVNGARIRKPNCPNLLTSFVAWRCSNVIGYRRWRSSVVDHQHPFQRLNVPWVACGENARGAVCVDGKSETAIDEVDDDDGQSAGLRSSRRRERGTKQLSIHWLSRQDI